MPRLIHPIYSMIKDQGQENLYGRQHFEYSGASLEDVLGQSLEMVSRENQNLS